MACFAPPARRDNSLYSSIFQADSGGPTTHPRASIAEVAAILHPEALNLYTNGRKPDVSAPANDSPWHFWSAQLIHYGLPFTKEKSRAKMRLLDALNSLKLELPAWVLKMEAELKKQETDGDR
ncbi:hypothetical protein EK21DRAFT_117321 [Setomelanomma holmii]|uniref:Uncharacterized protein n=1 Tax=Setomelanomma holmii TaxID=210430 RepID=A0A9P4H0Q4_9PLEO|nr:hypothetical protein EK21DRAFT_117321 [Setomelanomma holmii]